eukprot:TRINITY_DN9837_c0_g1_i1.p1 TRINITY_DN9837_c0_g1~~TRINITY_DN9837_c0_g1_i1.p1  ORF type:complete len:200 (+),score=26.74 TRINITY_DN9837_c0_g1_i1:115-714(+)
MSITFGNIIIPGYEDPTVLLLEYLGATYERKVYKSREEFQEEAGKFDYNYINIPYIKDGDRVVARTEPIAYYLCQKFGRKELLGKDQQEIVTLRAVCGQYGDLFWDFEPYVLDPTSPLQNREKVVLYKFHPRLRRLSNCLKDKEFFLGEITFIDFYLASLIKWMKATDEEFLKPYPNLVSFVERVQNIPQVKTYLSSSK